MSTDLSEGEEGNEVVEAGYEGSEGDDAMKGYGPWRHGWP
jgi:hypothetical protein